MKTKLSTITPNQRVIIVISIIALLLLIPLIAMQFTDEVNWNTFDFMVAGIILMGTGLAVELVLRTIRSTQKRILLCGFILFVLFLIWAELAVGIFGSPFAGS